MAVCNSTNRKGEYIFDPRTMRVEAANGRYFLVDKESNKILGELLWGKLPFADHKGITKNGVAQHEVGAKEFADALGELVKEEEKLPMHSYSWAGTEPLPSEEQQKLEEKLAKRGQLPEKAG